MVQAPHPKKDYHFGGRKQSDLRKLVPVEPDDALSDLPTAQGAVELGLAEYLEIAGDPLADNAQGQVESRAVTGIDHPYICESLSGRQK
jgi:hypothetical protein